LAGRMLFKIAYLLVRRILGLAVLISRSDLAKDAELLVLRHENAVLRRHAGRVRYGPADRVWLAALARLIPRRRWAAIFPITPATLLAWHRTLVAGKYDTSKRTLIWNQAHLRRILRQYETHHNRHWPHRSLDSAAPLKPLPEPVDLEQHRVRRRPRVGGMINEYRLVA
jgi:hypothetical protein